jgi:hypothetical protein
MRLACLCLLLTACSDYDLKRDDDVQGADTADEYVPPDAASPSLQITPDPLEFGYVGIGCEEVEAVTLENVGDADLTVSAIAESEASFYLLADPELPLVLAPGETYELSVGFSPSSDAVSEGQLLVDSDDPAGQKAGAHTGQGALEGNENLDTWTMPEDPPTDILFSVDSSCSMTENIWQLNSNFEPFVELLEGLTGYWQIIVANKADGCNHSGILTPYTLNLADVVQGALFAFNWQDDYTEALLTVNDYAVQNTDAGECNSTFMREGAMLHIIDISDEPEQSPELTGRSWDTIIDSIIAKKGSAALTTISAIAGDLPKGCDSAAAGDGYWEATEATGGVFLSICDEWYDAANLAALAEVSVNQDTFELSQPAEESTIEVRVNGEVRTDWTYDAASNTVTVTGDAPGGGDVVEIWYLAPGDCD